MVAYLLLESFSLAIASIFYWFALVGVVVGSVFAWHGLDADVKVRIHSFLNSVIGFKKIDLIQEK